MAVTKLIRIKERKSGDPGGGLHAALRYILNPKKAELAGGSAGTNADAAYSVMKRNKEYWNKSDGSQGFHYIISLPPSCRTDAGTLARVAEDFARELLGERYYYTYAVHTDHAHLHVHVVFDSVSMEDGIKFHSPKGDWEKRIQPISDRICQKYGLPPLEFGEERTGVGYGEWKARRKPQDRSPYIHSRADLMRDDIDEAILRSPSYGAFIRYMESLGYTVRDGKYLSLRQEGRERAVRSYRLGKGYSKEEIQERIQYVRSHPVHPEDFRVYGDMETVRRLLFAAVRKNGRWHMSVFQRAFFRSWRNTCLIRRPDFRGSRGSRAAVLELEELSGNLQFLIREDIRSLEDLERMQTQIENERKAVQSELNSVRSRLYRNEICRLVKKRKQLKAGYWLTAEEEDQIGQLDREISRVMPVGKAVDYYDSLLERRSQCLDQIRELKSRGRLCAGINRWYRDELKNISEDRDLRQMKEEIEGRIAQARAEKEKEKDRTSGAREPGREEVIR